MLASWAGLCYRYYRVNRQAQIRNAGILRFGAESLDVRISPALSRFSAPECNPAFPGFPRTSHCIVYAATVTPTPGYAQRRHAAAPCPVRCPLPAARSAYFLACALPPPRSNHCLAPWSLRAGGALGGQRVQGAQALPVVIQAASASSFPRPPCARHAHPREGGAGHRPLTL